MNYKDVPSSFFDNFKFFIKSTGSKPNGFASQLAKLLETKVIAPNEKIRVDEFGEFIIDRKGKFVEFNKQKYEIFWFYKRT